MAKRHKPTGVSIERRWWKETYGSSPNKQDWDIADEALKRLGSKKKRKDKE